MTQHTPQMHVSGHWLNAAPQAECRRARGRAGVARSRATGAHGDSRPRARSRPPDVRLPPNANHHMPATLMTQHTPQTHVSGRWLNAAPQAECRRTHYAPRYAQALAAPWLNAGLPAPHRAHRGSGWGTLRACARARLCVRVCVRVHRRLAHVWLIFHSSLGL
eukprot:11228282-Lingulodinium_polyedra.AAC.2